MSLYLSQNLGVRYFDFVHTYMFAIWWEKLISQMRNGLKLPYSKDSFLYQIWVKPKNRAISTDLFTNLNLNFGSKLASQFTQIWYKKLSLVAEIHFSHKRFYEV